MPHADTLQVWKNGFNMASPWGESNGNEQTPKVCVRASHSFRCFQCTLDTLTVSASVLCVRCLLCVCVFVCTMPCTNPCSPWNKQDNYQVQ